MVGGDDYKQWPMVVALCWLMLLVVLDDDDGCGRWMMGGDS